MHDICVNTSISCVCVNIMCTCTKSADFFLPLIRLTEAPDFAAPPGWTMGAQRRSFCGATGLNAGSTLRAGQWSSPTVRSDALVFLLECGKGGQLGAFYAQGCYLAGDFKVLDLWSSLMNTYASPKKSWRTCVHMHTHTWLEQCCETLSKDCDIVHVSPLRQSRAWRILQL